MTDPAGNSEIFPLDLNVPLGFTTGNTEGPGAGNKTHWFPWGQSLSAAYCISTESSSKFRKARPFLLQDAHNDTSED